MIAEYVGTLEDTYNATTVADRAKWAEFYPRAGMLAQRWALQYDLPLHTVCNVIASTSPQQAWERNVSLAHAILDHHAVTGQVPLRGMLGTVRTFVQHALQGAALGDIGSANARKVRAFARNLAGDYQPVTVDRHMLTAVGGTGAAVTKREYERISAAVRALADMHAMPPATMQAILWGAVRQGKGYPDATYFA